MDTIAKLLLTTIFIGSFTIYVSYVLTRTLINCSTVYWFSWLLLEVCAGYSIYAETIPYVSSSTYEIVTLSMIGASGGFILGSLYSGYGKNGNLADNENLNSKLNYFVVNYFNKILLTLLLLGVLSLLFSLGKVSSNVDGLLADIRVNSLESNFSTFDKFASYSFTIVNLLAIILGRLDAIYKPKPSRLIYIIVVSAIQGISYGGRGFLAGIILPYMFSFLLTVRVYNQSKSKYKWLLIFLGKYFMIAILIFTVLGVARWGITGEGSSSIFIIVDMVTNWIGLSLPAIDGFVNIISTKPLGYGAYVFDMLYYQFNKIGLTTVDIRDIYWSTVLDVRDNFGYVGNAPPTLIPKVVGDFGYDAMPYYLGFLLFFCQIYSIKYRNQGIIKYTISVLVLMTAFYSIQEAYFLNPLNIFTILWAVILSIILKKLGKIKIDNIYSTI